MDRPRSAMSRIGNLVINTQGTRKDQEAWKEIKEYMALLEPDINCDHEYEEHNYTAVLCTKCHHIEVIY